LISTRVHLHSRAAMGSMCLSGPGKAAGIESRPAAARAIFRLELFAVHGL
jgi:hypothetical protein